MKHIQIMTNLISTSPTAGCIEWFKRQAQEIGLEFNIVEFPKPDEFAVWLTWKGTDPSLKTIMLNSHIDVVPVEPVNACIRRFCILLYGTI